MALLLSPQHTKSSELTLQRLFSPTGNPSCLCVFVVICVYLCLSVVAVSSDTIVLKNGSYIEGTIIKDDGKTVTLALEWGKISIDHSEIESIVKSEYKPETFLPPEEEPQEKLPEIEPVKPVSPTQTAPPIEKKPFKISDEDKTPQQKKINAFLEELMGRVQTPEGTPVSDTSKGKAYSEPEGTAVRNASKGKAYSEPEGTAVRNASKGKAYSEPWQIVSTLVEETKNDIPYVLALLKEVKDPIPRRWLIYVLGRTKDKRILEPLRPELKHPEEIVREATVKALSHFKDLSLQSEFKELLEKETVSGVRCALIKALTSWQDRSIIPDLIDFLGDKNQTLRYVASQSLVDFYQQAKGKETPGPDVLTLLIEKLSFFVEPLLKKEIVTILGQLKDKRSLEALLNLLMDEDDETRSLAAMALANIADKKTIQILQERLREETDVWTRIQIMQVFQKNRDYDTIPTLIETLQDPEENIRFAASRALRTITKRSFGANYERWKKWWDTLQGK